MVLNNGGCFLLVSLLAMPGLQPDEECFHLLSFRRSTARNDQYAFE